MENEPQLKYLWQATFQGAPDSKHVITQRADDRYSKHDDSLEQNPSSYRDFLDYFEVHESDLRWFDLISAKTGKLCYRVRFWNIKPDITKAMNIADPYGEIIHDGKVAVTHCRPIYSRRVEHNLDTGKKEILHYELGYTGKQDNGAPYSFSMTIE